MSLLDSTYGFEPVVVYPQVTGTDIDGNVQTRASDTGIDALARFQPMLQTGTASRRAEGQLEGYETEEMYNMRFPRGWDAANGELGPQTKIVWRGETWSVEGQPARYNSSAKTAHLVYKVARS